MKNKQKVAGLLSMTDLKTSKGKAMYAFIVFCLLIVSAVCLLPTLWIVLTSLKDTQEIYNDPGFFPKNLSLEIFVTRISEAWKALDAGNSLLNSLYIGVGDVVFSVVLSGLGGYVLSKLKPTGTKLIIAILLWTMMMPAQIRTVPTFMSYLSFPFLAEIPGEVSLLNTFWPMWLSAAASAFNLLLYKSQFDSIPTALVEAAKIDGCGNMRIFFQIMIPLSVPTIMYTSIITMQAAWGNFFGPYLILTKEELQPLAVKLFNAKSDPAIKMNTYMMCLILASVPSFIFYIFFQKYIVGGISVGAVKG